VSTTTVVPVVFPHQPSPCWCWCQAHPLLETDPLSPFLLLGLLPPVKLDTARLAKGDIRSRMTAPAPSTASAGVAAPLLGMALSTEGEPDLLLLLAGELARAGPDEAAALGAVALGLLALLEGSSGLTILGGDGALEATPLLPFEARAACAFTATASACLAAAVAAAAVADSSFAVAAAAAFTLFADSFTAARSSCGLCGLAGAAAAAAGLEAGLADAAAAEGGSAAALGAGALAGGAAGAAAAGVASGDALAVTAAAARPAAAAAERPLLVAGTVAAGALVPALLPPPLLPAEASVSTAGVLLLLLVVVASLLVSLDLPDDDAP